VLAILSMITLAFYRLDQDMLRDAVVEPVAEPAAVPVTGSGVP